MAQFIGRVVGTKMQKTAKVSVTRMLLHPQVFKVLERGEEYVRSGVQKHYFANLIYSSDLYKPSLLITV